MCITNDEDKLMIGSIVKFDDGVQDIVTSLDIGYFIIKKNQPRVRNYLPKNYKVIGHKDTHPEHLI